MSSVQQASIAGQGAMPPPAPKRGRRVGTVPGVTRSVRAGTRQTTQQEAGLPAGTTAYDLIFTITINSLYGAVKAISLPGVKSPFESGKQSDSDAAWAVDLVALEVTNMLGRTLGARDFDAWLSRLDGVLRCAYASLTNKSTLYAMHVKSMIRYIEVFSDAAEDAETLGAQYFRREVAA